MEYQSPLHKKLRDGNFIFTAETTPPDAANKETLLKKIEPLKDIADAIPNGLPVTSPELEEYVAVAPPLTDNAPEF